MIAGVAMENLTEIKPNNYVVNLPTFEENELAKRKKKRTTTGKKSSAVSAAGKTKKSMAEAEVPKTTQETVLSAEVDVKPEEAAPPVEPASIIQESKLSTEVSETIQEPASAAEAAVKTQESPPPAELAEASQEATLPPEVTSETQESALPTETADAVPEPPSAADKADADPEPAPSVVIDNTITIKQTKVIYDEDTRLYTIETDGEFYDDSLDLDRIVRTIRALVPDATEKELDLLKEL